MRKKKSFRLELAATAERRSQAVRLLLLACILLFVTPVVTKFIAVTVILADIPI